MLYYKKHISGNPYSTLERWFDLLYPFLEKGVLFWMILISVAACPDDFRPCTSIPEKLAVQRLPWRLLSALQLLSADSLDDAAALIWCNSGEKMVSFYFCRGCSAAHCYIFRAANLFILRTDSAFDWAGVLNNGKLGYRLPTSSMTMQANCSKNWPSETASCKRHRMMRYAWQRCKNATALPEKFMTM